jgi:phosphatidylserine/phosphatidylglycerophosphate/cardiolipin synthase-like enzyme
LKLKSLSRKFGKTHSSLFYILTLGSLGVAIFSGHWFLNRSQSGIQPLMSVLPQDDAIRVYFNHNQAVEFSEPYRQKTRRGDDLAARIIAMANSAQFSIDVAVQELKLPNIAQALAAKAQAGVKVRVILENNYSRPLSELTAVEVAALNPRQREHQQEFQQLVDIDGNGNLSPDEINQRDALIILRNARIPILDDTADGSKGSGLMHHKFMVVDGRKVIVTSANWTMSDVYGGKSK